MRRCSTSTIHAHPTTGPYLLLLVALLPALVLLREEAADVAEWGVVTSEADVAEAEAEEDEA